jgi:hypothetical protein
MLQPMFHVRLRTIRGKVRAVPVKSFGFKQVTPPVTPFKS